MTHLLQDCIKFTFCNCIYFPGLNPFLQNFSWKWGNLLQAAGLLCSLLPPLNTVISGGILGPLRPADLPMSEIHHKERRADSIVHHSADRRSKGQYHVAICGVSGMVWLQISLSIACTAQGHRLPPQTGWILPVTDLYAGREAAGLEAGHE
jgi:hypothetical protein